MRHSEQNGNKFFHNKSLNHGIRILKFWWKSGITIPQSSYALDEILIQLACLDDYEAIPYPFECPDCLEQGFRKSFQSDKNGILIMHNSCYRSSLSIWAASKWCLEWIWSKRMDLLVQVLENWSLCVKLHFHGNLKSVFELWCF